MARIDLRVEVRKFSDVFDRQPALLNLTNGTVNPETGILREHRREDYITKMVPIDYDPRAEAPRFIKFLEDTFPIPETRIYLQRFAGLCLTGKSSAQAWWLFYGVTASGKSTLLNILRGILGPYAFSLPENYFVVTKNTADFATANLQGVRLATAVETNEGRTLDVAKIKALTGEDTISAALKHQNYFEFKPQAKLVLATNHRPRIPVTDDSIWRRVKVVGFELTVPPEKRIEGLADSLIDTEAAGILRWAVEGCQAGKVVEPEAVSAAIAEYRSAEDVVSNFLSDCTVRDENSRTSRTELSKAFCEWCKVEGIRQMSGKRLVAELVRLGIQKASRDPERYFDFVRLRGSL
jgi:putative DNA primase/helicase